MVLQTVSERPEHQAPIFSLDAGGMQPAAVVADELEVRVSALWAWDMARVKAYCQKTHGCSDAHMEALDREYKRYLELRLRYPALNMPMADPVDPLWHAHILFTPDYRRMCEGVFGRYLDHKPYESPAEFEELRSAYQQNTLGLYARHFGQPDEVLWPLDQQCCTYNCG